MSEAFSAMDVSSSALTAQRRRLELLISNLANAQVTRTQEGGPYRRKDLVFASQPMASFADIFMETRNAELLVGVKVEEVVTDPTPPVMKYEPGHPDADEHGYVAYPNVNPMEEMANLLNATRSFEANVRAFEALKQLLQRSIDLGRSQ
jgi:flagellar basal-body rod protein FlgC